MKRFLFCILFIFLNLCFTQENSNTSLPEQKLTIQELPQGYRQVKLGMSIENVKDTLKEDPIFGYRGERDISILAGKNRSLIETSGSSNIKRAWFQFYEEKLYIIIIQMNTDNIDYYSVYSALCKKYGEPDTLDPKRALWKNDTVSMILERPLAIKYIDSIVFNELLEKSKTETSYKDIFREEFINEF